MPAPRVTSKTPWHVVFVLDDSGSMAGDDSKVLNEALRAMIDEMTILTQGQKPYFKISIISFGSSAKSVVEGVSEADIDLDKIATFAGESGGTNMADALHLASEVLQRVPSQATDFTPYVFLMTDGHDHNPSAAADAASDLTKSDVPAGTPTLVTIGIGAGTQNEDFLKNIASDVELYKGFSDPAGLIKLFPAIGTIAHSSTGEAAIKNAIANI